MLTDGKALTWRSDHSDQWYYDCCYVMTVLIDAIPLVILTLFDPDDHSVFRPYCSDDQAVLATFDQPVCDPSC